MQTSNNYSLMVYNGDIGYISSIEHDIISVYFPDYARTVAYSRNQARDLTLAYAITIHKSQGSEYRAVILPLLSGPRMLMNRNLLYTAVTRAKTMVCILGQSRTVEDMIYNESEEKRNTGFERRIREMAEMDS